MSLDTWVALEQTPELLSAIAAESGDDLAVQSRLRDRFPAELVRLGLTLSRLRAKAKTKFSRADQMWFDAVRLEQATSEVVARHKAKRFRGHVTDLCCGLGADTIALAAETNRVRAIDVDPLCDFFVTRNTSAYGVLSQVEFSLGSAESADLDEWVHIDPDRRRGDRRVRRIEEYEPPLDFLQQLTGRVRGGAIKVSSAANFGGKFPASEIELVSLDGECKEATIWFGELAGSAPWRATALPSGESLAGDPLDVVAEVGGLHDYLFDPDPALVRSGLVDVFCDRHRLTRLDDAEEYLTADQIPESAFVTPFRILARAQNNAKSMRRLLRDHNITHVEVKARHVPIDANALQKKLSSKGAGKSGVLFVCRVVGKTTVVLCERVTQTGS